MGQILKDIYTDVSISPLLGLKGGTCAYFFYGLPRFSVDLDFDLQKPTFFFKDSLSVEFKGEAISFELTDGEFIVEDTRVELNNGKDYKIEFTINSPLVNKGDVIIIKDLGYLHCDNQRIKVGNIELNIK